MGRIWREEKEGKITKKKGKEEGRRENNLKDKLFTMRDKMECYRISLIEKV